MSEVIQMPSTILLDFDGTLTNTEEEAKPVLVEWDKAFSAMTGVPHEVIDKEKGDIKSRIMADPNSYGWVNDGCIVAPATADPYVFNTAVYQMLIPKLIESGFNLPSDKGSQSNMLQDLFRESYKLSAIVFQPGASEFLDVVLRNFNVVIVTNSGTDSVSKKLAKLGNHTVEIVGNAKKYVLSESDSVSESMQLEGLDRPVFLRRMHYKKILDGFDPSKTAVVGDIYELDLALPEYLGFSVVQLATPFTPAYEIAHHNSRPRNFFARSYNEALGFLLG